VLQPRKSRPSLTINKVREHNLLIKNEARQNKASIKVSPTGGDASYEAAEVFEGIIRYIEYRSKATVAYQRAGTTQVDGGIGYLRVKNEFLSSASFDQELVIKPIVDALSVYMDPDIQELDGSDQLFCFIFSDTNKDTFETKHPDLKDKIGSNTLGNTADTWITKDHIREAEYYRIVPTKDQLIGYMQNGELKLERKSKIPKELRKFFLEEVLTDERLESGETRVRDIIENRVEWYKIAGDQIIDRDTWLGKYIPVIRMVGEECIIEGRLDRKGHTRNLIDAQRMFNYNASASVEYGALQTKSPFLVPAKGIEGHEVPWGNANKENAAYLLWNHVDDTGQPIPKPEKIPPPQRSEVFTQGMQDAQMQMMMASGQYQADQGQYKPDESGKAIGLRQRRGDIATYHFIDNQGIAISQVGRILLDAIPKYYDTKRIVLMMAADGEQKKVHLDPNAEQAHQEQQIEEEEEARIIFNPNVGEYDAQADVGPNYATRRQETWAAFVQIISQAPALLPIVGDIMFRSADFPNADKIAERLKKEIEASKPYLVDEGMSPQYQKVMQDLQQANSTIAQLLQKLAEKELKLVGKDEKRDIEASRAETDRIKVLSQAVPGSAREFQSLVHQAVADALGTHLSQVPEANAGELQGQAGAFGGGAGGAKGTNGGGNAQAEQPPLSGARKASDGHWYVNDNARPGKYLRVLPKSGPPVQGARKAPDGHWYVDDKARPGKYLRVLH
jgi:hypothetical protein